MKQPAKSDIKELKIQGKTVAHYYLDKKLNTIFLNVGASRVDEDIAAIAINYLENTNCKFIAYLNLDAGE